MADRENLERLIGVVEGKLADLGPFPTQSGMEAWRQWRERAAEKVAELEREERASFRGASDTCTLMMGGVRTTCTSGRAGLLRNWINAARRRIEQEA